MSTVASHQQRVIDEKAELDEKTSKLYTFITTNPAFQKIAADEQQRLKSQAQVMDSYSLILGERIKAF